MAKKTLLETVREYGFFEVKEIIEATGKTRVTLQNWHRDKDPMLELVLLGLQKKKKQEPA